ncbi:Asp-tRNA(Asn)/Glu-tRNA(Gln) amidotransferase subunit GatA [Sulfurovum sp.]|uniref:Asp-tRNA(Asn)/Glu-tRNA(Gln) amidotransferase subunit GatA n=1 Tax=Sulfurovum sp. TaxID=1969726 RepID=UPI002A3595AD|nr:Asp-tRNA(Asn)/Glu-tRNA(Gln) amidotransferase subunit GatA [Sulfurovum sp.]MDD2450787.1 Asp-tRNA(Asn)/Glu-tRNA(Gln) amidotransferase subunit GatA [Sulfurovum sp.]MDD3498947.1 Asp-tRNA(Asn)/Glu-tRNA(Gln) amidotransferase subunit GatA [Sulfurovum sp.]MDY0402499.1 Asp-tRNA(Asn)/Glu-tRNA(Gln) amidotransferase subunit GatA [Sulfurovum sp.]
MITLKEALAKSKEELAEIRAALEEKAKASDLNAYVGFESSGEGVPILIKDNIQVKGWSVTSASKILQGYIAPYEATAIKNLKAKGMMAFGRANMDEFAMGSTTESSYYGITKNPHDTSRVPGGSSGGSAAAVAAGIAIAALGSDTGGSIRQPAAYCGVVGMKPTYGRVSRYGLAAYASSLDQIGPITQNVEDAAILYDAIKGHDEKDSTSADFEIEDIANHMNPDRKLTIAVIDNYISEADGDVQKAYADTVKALEEAGHTIVHKNMQNTKYDIATYYILATAEAATNLARFDGVRYGTRAESKTTEELFFNTRSEGFGEEVKRRILLGNFVLSSGFYDAYYLKAQKVRHLIQDEFNAIFAESDLILSPVAPSVAPKIGANEDPLEMYKSDMYTIAVNLAGLPAISLPVAKNDEGMPVGLQLIAKKFDEKTLFDGAMSMERAVNYQKS